MVNTNLDNKPPKLCHLYKRENYKQDAVGTVLELNHTENLRR